MGASLLALAKSIYACIVSVSTRNACTSIHDGIKVFPHLVFIVSYCILREFIFGFASLGTLVAILIQSGTN